jgi:hypothetical protein
VESFWYSRVIERLAKQRFVVASSDYYRAFPYKTRVLPSKFSSCRMRSAGQCFFDRSIYLNFYLLPAGPGCRQDAIVDVSARLINTLYDFIENVTNGDLGANREFDFLRRANLGQLLLLSHSLGAFVACDVLTGMPFSRHEVDTPDVFQGGLHLTRMDIMLNLGMHAQVVAKHMLPVMAHARGTHQF